MNKQELLKKINDEGVVPVASFRLRRDGDAHVENIAMEFVLLDDENDDLGKIRERSEILRELEDEELIEINFDLKTDNIHYENVYKSSAYKLFCDMVKDGSKRENFIFNIAHVEEGVIMPFTKKEKKHGNGCGCGCGHSHH